MTPDSNKRKALEYFYIANATSEALVDELVERGVLRIFGVQEYVPGIVMARSGRAPEDMDRYMSARLVASLSRVMAQYNLIAFSKEAPDDPAAPPNDRVWVASILTVDPEADLSRTGNPGVEGNA